MEYTISWKSIFRIILALAIVYLSTQLVQIILVIFISMMLAAAFSPIVSKLKTKMPVTLASVLVMLVLLSPIVLISIIVIPNLIQQFPEILKTINSILGKATILPPSLREIDLTQYTSNIASYVLQSTSKITNFVTTFITAIFLTLYFLIDSQKLLDLIYSLVPYKHTEKAKELIEQISRVNGQYIRGNLIISVICGVLIFAGLAALKVPYAGSLALFAAVVDLLPLVGAFIGAIPAVIVAFSVSPTIGILTLGLFLIYQQIENNILAPNIYQRALDLSPALSFISVIIGASLFGVLGAFIALPIAASIPTIVKFLRQNHVTST